ncbi:hypothetical protein KY321_03335 [Candidatus Woesearchaeota archaeon]|nr:hypothetical protein [Candidatus Woesearchaeota archaeon]
MNNIMDVEKIKRINEMTKTLKQHGMVSDTANNEQAAEQLTGQELPKQEDVNNIDKNQVQVLIERSNRRFMEIIESLKKEIMANRGRIEELERRPAQIVERTTSQPVVKEESEIQINDPTANEAPVVQQEPVQQPVQAQAKPERKEHARCDTSKINQEDFSVEKFFYYGNK